MITHSRGRYVVHCVKRSEVLCFTGSEEQKMETAKEWPTTGKLSDFKFIQHVYKRSTMFRKKQNTSCMPTTWKEKLLDQWKKTLTNSEYIVSRILC